MSCSFTLFAVNIFDLGLSYSIRYSHGYLFPSEVTRVKRSMFTDLKKSTKASWVSAPSVTSVGSVSSSHTPSAWAHSSVSTFGVRYNPSLPDLSPAHGVEALVEGSEMSMLREGAFQFEKAFYHFSTFS